MKTVDGQDKLMAITPEWRKVLEKRLFGFERGNLMHSVANHCTS